MTDWLLLILALALYDILLRGRRGLWLVGLALLQLAFSWLFPIPSAAFTPWLVWGVLLVYFFQRFKDMRLPVVYCLLQLIIGCLSWLTSASSPLFSKLFDSPWALYLFFIGYFILTAGRQLHLRGRFLCGLLLACLTVLYAQSTPSMSWLPLIAAFLCCCLCLELVRYLFAETDLVFARSLDQIMANYVQEIDQLYENVRGWRHDYHNHLQSLKTTVAEDRKTETLAYLEDLEKHLEVIEQIVKSGNTMMDAVVNSKLTIAQQQDIPINAKVFVGTQPLINDVDMVVILGNILDNAIEANLEISDPRQRLLRVYISILKQQLYIVVTNARPENQEIKPDYASTKNDKRGLGIRRINALVDKYDGLLNRQYEDGFFVTEILLPLTTITENN
ncbi:sensor histidine kinase [Candidatus Enterococcus leclercqii]|uniref:sensor histidine kinase n=1 Tax=Candidatus Enterococcus leclercqii TaxID=1857218 RepID=UPI001F41EF97|nr:sensor histidine kinase [Enterococcus sp. CU9D]